MKRTFYNDLEQGTPEWLQARSGIVTASTMSRLVTSTGKVAHNDTSRGFARQLAAERITGVPEFTYPTRPMQRGTALEPWARDLYAEHYAPVTEVGFIRADTDRFSLGYSPDGMVEHDGLIEIKSPAPKEHLRTILADEVPADYMWQVQTGLFVTGRSWLDYISYCPGADLYVKRIYPDPVAHETIQAAVISAEDNIRGYLHVYRETGRANNRVKTEWFDPFQEEEMVF